MHVRLADRQRLLALLQANRQVAAKLARDAGDRVDVDQRAAVDLPERSAGRPRRSSSLIGQRISDSAVAVTTIVYLWSARK